MRKYQPTLLLLNCFLLLISCSDIEDSVVDNVSKLSQENRNSFFVPKEEAQRRMLGILKGNALKTRSGEQMNINDITSSFTVGEPIYSDSLSDNPDSIYIHVFNFGENEGYCVMSGDSRGASVLAVSSTGSLREGGKIENPGEATAIKNALESFYVDPNIYINGRTPFHPEEQLGIYPSSQEIYYPNRQGMCKVHWIQSYPYNKYCPSIDSKPTVVGCVPIAVGQLMSVYKYPQSYKAYNFDWDNMIKGHSDDQVAVLLSELGTSENLNVHYGVKASSSSLEVIPRTFVNFGYSSGGYIVDYTTKDIVSELMNGYPVIVSGRATNDGGVDFGFDFSSANSSVGHAWLAHGLLEIRETKKYVNMKTADTIKTEIEDYYYPLYNFGWGGLDLEDGYYYSGNFDTGKGPYRRTEKYNFNMSNQLVIGIRK